MLMQAAEYVNYLTTISIRCRLCSVEWPMNGTMTVHVHAMDTGVVEGIPNPGARWRWLVITMPQAF